MICKAITSTGEDCKRTANSYSDYCYAHDPLRADERRENASTAARAKAMRTASPISAELTRLQQVFEKLADAVLEGEVDRSDAAVAIQALNGARGCVVGTLKAQEQEEMAAEIAEITASLAERGIEWQA
jgi:hypothetical protein